MQQSESFWLLLNMNSPLGFRVLQAYNAIVFEKGMHCYYVLVSFIKVQLKQVMFSCVVDVAMAMSQVAFFIYRISTWYFIVILKLHDLHLQLKIELIVNFG